MLVVELRLRVAAHSFIRVGHVAVRLGIFRVKVGLWLVGDRDVLRHQRVVHQTVLLEGVLG